MRPSLLVAVVVVGLVARIQASGHVPCNIEVKGYSNGDGPETNGYIRVNGDNVWAWEGTTNNDAYLAYLNADCTVKGMDDTSQNDALNVAAVSYSNVISEKEYLVFAGRLNGLSLPTDDDVLSAYYEMGVDLGKSQDEDISPVDTFIFIVRKGYPELSIYKGMSDGKGPRIVTWATSDDHESCTSSLPPFSIFLENVSGLRNSLNSMALDKGGHGLESYTRINLDDTFKCNTEVRGWMYYGYNKDSPFYIDVWKMGYNADKFELINTSGPHAPEKQSMGEASYMCLDSPVPVPRGAFYGVHYPKESAAPGIYRAHAYEQATEFPCAESVTWSDADRVLVFLDGYHTTADMPDELPVTGLSYEGFAIDMANPANLAVDGSSTTTVQHMALGVRPIVDKDFVYTCGCESDADCQAGGDVNMMCAERKCKCRLNHIYNSKHGKCINYDWALAKPVNSSETKMNSEAANAVDENKESTLGSATCTATKPGNPWLVIDLEYNLDIHAVSLTTPKPLDSYAEITGGTQSQSLIEENNEVSLPSVSQIKMYGPWPWLLIARTSDRVVLNRDMLNKEQEFKASTDFKSVSTNVGRAIRLVHVGYVMLGNDCLYDDPTLGLTSSSDPSMCTTFYMEGNKDDGYQIRKLNEPNIDSNFNFNTITAGSPIVLGPAKSTYLFLDPTTSASLDASEALKGAFKIRVKNIEMALTYNSGLILSDLATTTQEFNFKYHPNLHVGEPQYNYHLEVARKEADATAIDYRADDYKDAPCVEVYKTECPSSSFVIYGRADVEGLYIWDGSLDDCTPGPTYKEYRRIGGSTDMYFWYDSGTWYAGPTVCESSSAIASIASTVDNPASLTDVTLKFAPCEALGGSVVSKNQNQMKVDGFNIPPRTDKDQTLYTAAGSLLARVADLGLRNFTIGVSSDPVVTQRYSDVFVPAEFTVCTKYAGHPLPGISHRFDCDQPVNGRYVAIWMEGDDSKMEICNVDVHIATEKRIGQKCLNDTDCAGVMGVDQHLMCHNVTETCECFAGFKFWEQANLCVDVNECEEPNMNSCKTENASLVGEEDGECINTIGAYLCHCPEGMRWDRAQGGCKDINETLEANCGCDDRCENRFVDDAATGNRKYECYCDKPGLQLGNNSKSCEDVNECLDTTICGTGTASCVNTVGSYHCMCPPHTKWVRNTLSCDDINECLDKNGGCEGQCQDSVYVSASVPPYTCDCDNMPGYKLAPDGHGCIDIDECSDNTHDCANPSYQPYDKASPQEYVQGVCANHVGNDSTVCLCPAGYRWNDTGAVCQDVDECSESRHECEHVCTNTPGAYTCSCRDGFLPLVDQTSCGDINECDTAGLASQGISVNVTCFMVDETEPGVEDSQCVNTEGSYRCMCDKKGYTYNETLQACVDIDECAMDNGWCEATCENLFMDVAGATHRCSCPEPGLRLSPDGMTCVDINECSNEAFHNCSFGTQNRNSQSTRYSQVRGDCINNRGSYRCMCPEGYRWDMDQLVCQDIDECLENPCEQTCTNLNGTFQCSCTEGYRLLTDKRGCQDQDECASGTDSCSQLCVNKLGSYKCDCRPGYSLNANGVTCDNVNECLVDNGGCQHICMDSPGSHSCACNATYILMKDGRSCDDKNECLTTNDCQQTCINTVGSYRCGCNEGYQFQAGSTTDCQDVNECTPEHHNGWCDHVCENTVGSRKCSCNTGYRLSDDGMSCIDINECAVGGPSLCEDVCVNTPGGYVCLCDGISRRGIDTDKCIYGRILRFSICLNTMFQDVYYKMTDPATMELAKGIETTIEQTLYAESIVARQNGFEYQVVAFSLCENTKTQAEVVALPRVSVGEETQALLAADAARLLPRAAFADNVALAAPPLFIYAASTGTERFTVLSECDWMDNMKICGNGGKCVAQGPALNCSCAAGYAGVRCEVQTSAPLLSTTEVGLIAGLGGLGLLCLVLACCLCCFLGRNNTYSGGSVDGDGERSAGKRLPRDTDSWSGYPPAQLAQYGYNYDNYR